MKTLLRLSLHRISAVTLLLSLLLIYYPIFGQNSRPSKKDDLQKIETLLEMREYGYAKKIAQNTLRIAEKSKNLSRIARSKYYLGISSFELTNTDSAILWLLDAEQDFKKMQDEKWLLKTYTKLGSYLRQTDSNDSSMIYFQNALALAKQMGDTDAIALTQYGMGRLLNQMGCYPRALRLYLEALDTYRNRSNPEGEANILNSLGILYWLQGEYNEALKYLKKSLQLKAELNDLQGVAHLHNNIGLIMRDLGKTDRALSHFRRSWNYKIQLNDIRGISNSLLNIASIYLIRNKLDSALIFLDQAEAIKRQIKERSGIAWVNLYRGKVYLKLKLYDKSVKYLKQALETYIAFNEPRGIAECKLQLAKCRYEQRRYREALELLQETRIITREYKMLDICEKAHLYSYKIYTKLNDCTNSLKFYKLYIAVRDTLMGTESYKHYLSVQLSENYDSIISIHVQNKNTELQRLIKDKKQKGIIINILITIIGLIVIFLIVFYYSYINNKKRNQLLLKNQVEVDKQKEELVLQRDEIQRQKDLVIYQRDRIIKMLTDLGESIDYARKIQQAILPNEAIIRQHFNDYFILNQPKESVGGDFYWIGNCSGITGFAIADCTGHGVPGGFMSMLGLSMLNNLLATDSSHTPSSILTQLRKSIISALRQQGGEFDSHDGMDIAFCTYDRSSRLLTYSGANMPIIINTRQNIKPSEKIWVHSTDLIEIRPDRMPIGYYDKMDSFEEITLTLNPGDSIYLFTDGFVDQFGGPESKKFGYSAFRSLINSIKHLPFSEQQHQLWITLEKWKGEIEVQTDDILILAVKVK